MVTLGKNMKLGTKTITNKAISMMRGKSQRSDVEMTNKKKLSWRPSWIFYGYFSINFDQTWYTHIKFTSDYVLFFA